MAPKKQKPEPDAEPGDVDVAVEIDPLHEWRCLQLQKAGFTQFQAFRLSVNGADWHDCVRLLEDGCPAELILDILGL